MAKQKLTDILRFRADRRIRKRVEAVATKRGCDPSDVLREATMTFIEGEEKRLGLPTQQAA